MKFQHQNSNLKRYINLGGGTCPEDIKTGLKLQFLCAKLRSGVVRGMDHLPKRREKQRKEDGERRGEREAAFLNEKTGKYMKIMKRHGIVNIAKDQLTRWKNKDLSS